jgi:hypothetical protein
MHRKTIHDASNVPSHVLMFPFCRAAFEVCRLVCLRECYPNLLLAMGLDLPQSCSSSDNSAHVPEPF